MPRPFKCRRIAMQPRASAFKPAGVPGRELKTVVLGLDEAEALRLADLEGLYQEDAAARMGISRATFGRLVEEARRKVVSAIFGSMMLVFEGGPVTMANMRTFRCQECKATFEEPFGTGRPDECPHCHGKTFHRVHGSTSDAAEHRGFGRGAGGGARQGHCRRQGARRAEGTASPAKGPAPEGESR
jgi:predicted DNA-binding protein (UPF0251 family)